MHVKHKWRKAWGEDEDALSRVYPSFMHLPEIGLSLLPIFILPRVFPNMRNACVSRVHRSPAADAGTDTGVDADISGVVKSGTVKGNSMVVRGQVTQVEGSLVG